MSENPFLKAAKEQIANKKTLEPEMAGSQMETGDVCGAEEGKCDRTIHVREFGEPELPPHSEAPVREGHCPIHGIVGSER